MDILARRKVHHRVRPPLGGPAHLLHFLLDARSDGAVPDIGVDLHQEIAPDNHRLALRMIDIGRNNRPPTRDLRADEFGSDLGRNLGAEGFAAQRASLVVRGPWSVIRSPVVPWSLFFAPKVFAYGDELHLRRDNTLPGIMQLGDDVARFRAKRFAPQRRRNGRVAAAWNRAVCRLNLFKAAARQNPGPPPGWYPLLHIAIERSVPPRPGAIINPRRRVGLSLAIERFRRAKPDFPEWHTNSRVQLSRHIDFDGIGQRLAALGLKRILACNHITAFRVSDFAVLSDLGFRHSDLTITCRLKLEGKALKFPSPALPGAGSTRSEEQ